MVNYLTSQDVQHFGSDLVDFAQRASVHALGPALQQIQQDHAELRQRLAVEARARLDQQVAAAVPDFREIDSDPRWHQWLRTPDPLSGRVRQEWLNQAIADNATQRVIRFFQEFQNQAAGQTSSHGRARSSGAAVYTRPQIAQLYEMHRKGHWAGREAEWNRIEADVIAAGREGRISAPAYITK